jgi:hypothetical protein
MTEAAYSLIEHEKADWPDFFQSLLDRFSKGKYEAELLRAKTIFFEKLGRSHEIRQEYFDSVSQSFLEWYIFDYVLLNSKKTPAVTFVTNQLGEDHEIERLRQALFHHWSLFEVIKHEGDQVELKDLLVGVHRKLLYENSDPSFRLWKVQSGQLVQARLFRLPSSGVHFATHVWLHGDGEKANLQQVIDQYRPLWGLHREMLRQALECLVRSLGLRDQMMAVSNKNWIYQDFVKRHAKKK